MKKFDPKQIGQVLQFTLQSNAGRLKNGYKLLTKQLPTPEVGTTPHKELMNFSRIRLLKYAPPETGRTHKTPLLFVPSLVNRYYVLDLIPERSVVNFVRAHGFQNYMVDWGNPGVEDQHTSLEDYVLKRLDLVVRRIIEEEGTPPTLIGYCMGGNLALEYASIHPENVAGLVLLATPVDFEKAGLLSQWARPEIFNLDKFVEGHGLIPPDLLNWAFTMLKPSWQTRQTRDLVKWGWNDDFLRGYLAISKWVNDSVFVAGETFRQFVQQYYRDNGLMKDGVRRGTTLVRPADLHMPVLNVIAEKDHIVPKECSQALQELMGTNLETQVLPVGHIGLSVGGGAFSKVWKNVLKWLVEHDATMEGAA